MGIYYCSTNLFALKKDYALISEIMLKFRINSENKSIVDIVCINKIVRFLYISAVHVGIYQIADFFFTDKFTFARDFSRRRNVIIELSPAILSKK